jgi:hypothetical protein
VRTPLSRRTREARIVVEIGDREIDAVGVAHQRPCRRARQDVDLAGLEGGQTLLAGQGHETRLLPVAEHGGGDGTAGVDVETAPIALVVGRTEPDRALV